MSDYIMKDIELKVGHVYEAKKPKRVGCQELINDRQIKWISSDGELIQYDGPAVSFGSRFPKVTKIAFLKWCGRDITDEMPAGEWRSQTGGEG